MTLTITAVDGIGEVAPGTDIASLVVDHADLRDGDVVVVTSKIVSKALGLATGRDKDEVIDDQTARVVARRGPTRIVRTHQGLTMAAAGVDASNLDAGSVLPLPNDPDGEARAIRSRIAERTGLRLGVVISDTAGRAWRVGQTDMAIGCAGVLPIESFAGRTDTHGNPLAVTAPAVADQIAGAAELASGKLGGRPITVVRGLPDHLLLDEDGPGAAALIRDEDGDLFGLGARDAVLAAVEGRPWGFPSPDATVEDLVSILDTDVPITVDGDRVTLHPEPHQMVEAGRLSERLRILSTAHRLPVSIEVKP